MQRITVHEDPDLTREHAGEVHGFPSTVEVVLDSGATFMRRTRWPKGHPRNPLGDDELEAKFRRLAGGTLSAKQTDRMLQTLLSFDRLADVEVLAAQFRSICCEEAGRG
jgi:2-methylcitrate dehydratase